VAVSGVTVVNWWLDGGWKWRDAATGITVA